MSENGVKIYGGERASHALSLAPAHAPKIEYGSNELTLELVSSLDEAIDHIHEYGSSHTEAIITGWFPTTANPALTSHIQFMLPQIFLQDASCTQA